MGLMYNGLCRKCGYTSEICLGSGLFSINLERNMSVLDQEEQNKLLAMKEKQEIKTFRIENYVAECPKCQIITGKTLIDVTDNDGIMHIFGESCGECGETLKVNRNWKNEEISCPKCSEKELFLSPTGHWD